MKLNITDRVNCNIQDLILDKLGKYPIDHLGGWMVDYWLMIGYPVVILI